MDRGNTLKINTGQIANLSTWLGKRLLTPMAIVTALAGILLLSVGLIRNPVSPAQPGGVSARQVDELEVALPSDIDNSSTTVQLNRALVPLTIIPDRPRNAVVIYTVNPGDSVISIARAFSLDESTIYWGNLDTLGTNVHMLSTNMALYILPTDGVYHLADGIKSLRRIAGDYNVAVDNIINSEYNNLEGASPDDVPAWGTRIVVPGGQGPYADFRAPVIETVDSSGNVSRAFMPGMAGSCAPMSGTGGTGVWVNPIQGYYGISQWFGPFHAGIDLGTTIGTPVVAADTGRVIFAGWVPEDWGYGQLIVLDHGNGWTTYYAHLSSVGVSCGQVVSRGSYIGAVGSTGTSTGAHLHFEMRWGHTPDNPENWIRF
nr:M23 family metallopeptidase [Anaerolineae bacterium]